MEVVNYAQTTLILLYLWEAIISHASYYCITLAVPICLERLYCTIWLLRILDSVWLSVTVEPHSKCLEQELFL